MGVVIQDPEVCLKWGFAKLGFSATPLFSSESPMILLLLYRDLVPGIWSIYSANPFSSRDLRVCDSK